jgi:hypothetical protein
MRPLEISPQIETRSDLHTLISPKHSLSLKHVSLGLLSLQT